MDTTFWFEKSVFISGASGLLGSHLSRALAVAGARVTILLRDGKSSSPLLQSPLVRRMDIVHGELESFDLLRRTLNEYEIEYVFHLGAQTQVTHGNRQPFETFETNIRGTYNLLEACRLHPGIQGVLVASSDKAYGTQPALPYREDAPLQGRHPYDVSKSCTDLIAQTYFSTYGLPVGITRCGNLYGPGDLNFARIVPDSIRCAYENKTLRLRSDGSFIRDYLFVGDGVDGYLTVAENLGRPEIVGQAFNLSTGNRQTVLEVVDAVARVSGRTIGIEILNRATGEIHDQYLDSSKAELLLGWKPKYGLDQGLGESVPAYFRFFETGSWI